MNPYDWKPRINYLHKSKISREINLIKIAFNVFVSAIKMIVDDKPHYFLKTKSAFNCWWRWCVNPNIRTVIDVGRTYSRPEHRIHAGISVDICIYYWNWKYEQMSLNFEFGWVLYFIFNKIFHILPTASTTDLIFYFVLKLLRKQKTGTCKIRIEKHIPIIKFAS